MKHEWKQWEAWENPEVDFETTFGDLMIDHKGHFFGSMSVQNLDENKKMADALENSKWQAARILGMSVEEFEEMQIEDLKKALLGE